MKNTDSSLSIWRNPLSLWVLFGITALLIGYAFYGTIQDMLYVWGGKEEYGYAYLIPFISIFLIWQRKNKLAEIEFIPSLLGIALVVFGGFLLLVGSLAASRTLPQYSLIITVLGVVYALLGWKAFKLVMVPLALLFFIVPLPLFIFQALSGKLQLISSQLGVEVIRWFGISVYLEGNVIDLGSYKLQVVEACSGLRYLFPLVSLSFIAAYLYQAEFWKRAIIFLSSIPITVFMNSFRIGVIGVLVEYGGTEQAEGFLHDFEGWFVFMACIAILVLEMAILARIGPRKQTLAEAFAIDFPEPFPADVTRKEREIKPISWIVPVIVAVIAVSNTVLQGREHISLERRVFAEFPLEMQGWEGTTSRLEENILRSLKTEDYIISDYVNDENR
ncbi:MAG: VPLPA-CTERM-specific exosortase XrtD, partial [Chloroflexota bacterium]